MEFYNQAGNNLQSVMITVGLNKLDFSDPRRGRVRRVVYFALGRVKITNLRELKALS